MSSAKAVKTLAFIKLESLFGNLIQNERFTTCYVEMVQHIYKDGDIKKQMERML